MDIDIDTPTWFKPEEYFDCIRATMITNGEIKPHPCGVYFQNINPECLSGNNLASIEYKQAEEFGFTKIDFLHLNMLDHGLKKDEVRFLVQRDPDWSLMKDPSVISKLFHLNKHHDVVEAIGPTSVDELADCLAAIRPGKRKLLKFYHKSKNWVREQLHSTDQDANENSYTFKRSHAIAYAHVIVLQLHLIKAGLYNEIG